MSVWQLGWHLARPRGGLWCSKWTKRHLVLRCQPSFDWRWKKKRSPPGDFLHTHAAHPPNATLHALCHFQELSLVTRRDCLKDLDFLNHQLCPHNSSRWWLSLSSPVPAIFTSYPTYHCDFPVKRLGWFVFSDLEDDELLYPNPKFITSACTTTQSGTWESRYFRPKSARFRITHY